MKESIYGFYPAAKDIWKARRDGVDTYRTECLYKQCSSRPPGSVPVPDEPISVKIQLSPRSERRVQSTPGHHRVTDSAGSRSALNTVPPRESSSKYRMAAAGEQDGGHVIRFVDSRLGSACSATVRQAATETTAYHRDVEQQPMTQFDRSYQRQPSAMSVAAPEMSSRTAWATKLAATPTYTAETPLPVHSSMDQRLQRCQSAAVYRPHPPTPTRPSKSATPSRTNSAVASATLPTEGSKDVVTKQAWPQSTQTISGCNFETKKFSEIALKKEQSSRPSAPTPTRSGEKEELGVDVPLNYDEQLKLHGWKMEIPGDPLRLKRPCLSKRLSVNAPLSTTHVLPPPPRMHMECRDTFFLNTIPPQKFSFTIHPDWASEVLLAKRVELLKRYGGERYGVRGVDYSFVY